MIEIDIGKGYDSIFATRLRKLMEGDENRPKTTKDVLAKAIKATKQSIYHYTTGRRFPNDKNLGLICEYFDASVEYLLGLTSEPKSSVICDLTRLKSETVEHLKK